MKTLFIDTSSKDVSIAIVSENKILASIHQSIPNAHSVYTVIFIDQVIKEAGLTPQDIDAILVVTGPGSFTGVRIGVTIAKTYAYLNKIKIVGVSSLKMMSLSCEHDYCLSLIDARHHNYYVGLYDKNNDEVIEEVFNHEDYVLDIIKKYKPNIVSDCDMMIGKVELKKQELDILKIVAYYQDHESLNPHLVVPNYLKLPQALESCHD